MVSNDEERKLVPSSAPMDLYVAEYRTVFVNNVSYAIFLAPNLATAQSVAEAYAAGRMVWDVRSHQQLVGAPTSYIEMQYYTELDGELDMIDEFDDELNADEYMQSLETYTKLTKGTGRMTSSFISAMAYDDEKGLLLLEFIPYGVTSYPIFAYPADREVWEKMIELGQKGESIGKYYHQVLRDGPSKNIGSRKQESN